MEADPPSCMGTVKRFEWFTVRTARSRTECVVIRRRMAEEAFRRQDFTGEQNDKPLQARDWANDVVVDLGLGVVVDAGVGLG